MTINSEEVAGRKTTWDIANSLVEPIVEKHGLEDLRSGNMFTYTVITTAVEQHIDHILRVANWLLDKGD